MMTSQVWKKQDRNLVKGDILRTKIGNKEHPKYGQFAYAVCTGDGFGCSTTTIGNAIFVKWQSFDLSYTVAHRNTQSPDELDEKWCSDPNCPDAGKQHGHIKIVDTREGATTRWERFWGIEYLGEK